MRVVIIISCAVILISGCLILLMCVLNHSHDITTRHHVNKRIIEMFKAGNSGDIYNFYDGFIKNMEATVCMVNTALMFDIPVHSFIGLAYQESKFDFNKISKKNSDGSYDIGGYQLNSKQYKKYKPGYLVEINNNVRMAGAHLADNYLQTGNYYSALGIYNSGNEKNIIFNHVKNILLYADQLDEKFATVF